MTFKCAVCASAFACVFCVNDDAHLCAACDRETHKNSLSRRHKRVPVTNNTGQFGLGGSDQLQLDTVPSLPSELLLEVNLAKELAHFDEAEDVSGDLDALLSYEPGAPLDFGIDLDKLVRNDKLDFYANSEPCFQVPQQQPSLLLPLSPPARPSATGLMEHTENSCKSDAVVPVLPSMPANNKRMEALLMEPCSPGSPNDRVVTTGSPQHGSKKLTVSASPSKGGASAPVQTAGDPAPGTKPSWIPAPLNKPEPITTNAALSSVGHSASVVNGTQSRKREREGEAPPRVSQPGLMLSQTDVPLFVPTASPPTIMDARAAGQLRGFTGSSSNMAGLHQSIHSYVDTETRAEKLARYRAKKARRRFQKTIRYQTRKDYAELRPRIKGRFVSPEEFAAWKAAQDCTMSVYRTQEEGVHIVPTA